MPRPRSAVRSDKGGTDRSGIGLGLSICLKAAEAHNGKLSVVDLAGKGCVFALDLPRAAQLPDHPRSRRSIGWFLIAVSRDMATMRPAVPCSEHSIR